MNFSRHFDKTIRFLRALRGWRRALAAFLAGSVMALSMPPFNLFPLIFLCLPGLIFLMQGCVNKKQAFAAGWCFGFGFLAFSLYWIAASMLVDIHKFWWAIPLSVIGLPACFALYNGIGGLLGWRLGAHGVNGAVMFGLCWFGGDWLRGNAFSGFPWNLLGYSWSGALSVLQVTSVIGIYGLTLLTTLAACILASLADHSQAARSASTAAVALFALLAAGGEIRLHSVKTADTPGVRLRLVQPDTDQATKWLGGEREKDFQKLLDMTSAPSFPPVTHYIWPETASTFYLAEDGYHRQLIADHIPSSSTLITGVIRRGLDTRGDTHYYNSLVAVDGLGRLVAGYDKSHLVPFGEYMPLRRWIPVQAIAADLADFTPGDGPRSLRVLGLPPFSPLICYEAIFPGDAVDLSDRPDFILNITNDAWYGRTIGPYQHFAIARVRAIEEGLPLVRVANTGISGIIDPLGRIQARLGLAKRGIIDGNLPAALPVSFYEKWRNGPAELIFLFCLCGTSYWKRPR